MKVRELREALSEHPDDYEVGLAIVRPALSLRGLLAEVGPTKEDVVEVKSAVHQVTERPGVHERTVVVLS